MGLEQRISIAWSIDGSKKGNNPEKKEIALNIIKDQSWYSANHNYLYRLKIRNAFDNEGKYNGVSIVARSRDN